MVGLCGGVVVLESLAHYHHVVAAAERVRVHLDGVEVGVGVAALRLIGRASIIIPDRKFINTFRRRVESFSFRSQTLAGTVNPNVQSLNPTNILTSFNFEGPWNACTFRPERG